MNILRYLFLSILLVGCEISIPVEKVTIPKEKKSDISVIDKIVNRRLGVDEIRSFVSKNNAIIRLSIYYSKNDSLVVYNYDTILNPQLFFSYKYQNFSTQNEINISEGIVFGRSNVTANYMKRVVLNQKAKENKYNKDHIYPHYIKKGVFEEIKIMKEIENGNYQGILSIVYFNGE